MQWTAPVFLKKKKKKKNASQLPLFSGVGITSTDKWQNVVSTQEPLCLLSCPCPVSTSVCDDVDVDHYRLYDAANELWQFETEFQCLFHSGQVTRFVVPLTCCCYFFSVLLHAPVETHSVYLFFFFFFLGSFAWYLRTIAVAFVPAENVEYVHSALHDEDVVETWYTGSNCNVTFYRFLVDVILQYIESQIISQCIPTVVLVVPRVCLCQ